MFAVIGLGNPGPEYGQNRHNLGFMVIDELAARMSVSMKEYRWHSLTGRGRYGSREVILGKPQTFMNRSGLAVFETVEGCSLLLDNVLVIMDDMSLPLGSLRLRKQGSSGGHNGLEDIIRAIDSERVPRLRLGIGHPPPNMDAVDFVLSDFSPEETDEVQSMTRRAAEVVLRVLDDGLDRTMQDVNSQYKEEEHEP